MTFDEETQCFYAGGREFGKIPFRVWLVTGSASILLVVGTVCAVIWVGGVFMMGVGMAYSLGVVAGVWVGQGYPSLDAAYRAALKHEQKSRYYFELVNETNLLEDQL